MHRLIGVAFSHYVEKARWALDRFGVPYRDERYLPLFHFAPVFLAHRGRAGRADKASTRLSTPVLIGPAGLVLSDSGAIVRHVSDRYAPPGQGLIEAADETLEQRLHDRLGPHSRRYAYYAMFSNRPLFRQVVRGSVGRVQRTLARAVEPVAVRSLTRLLDVSPEAAERSVGVVRAEFDLIADRLADGRRYLTGDRFTSTDLAFACMAAPPCLPAEYSVPLPALAEFPERERALLSELREHPAGQYALRLFREERNRIVVS